MAYTPRSDAELRTLAMDIVDGRVFTSDRLRETEISLMRLIFMPIGLANADIVQSWRDNEITMFYEFFTEAGQRSINGYPMFPSVRVVSKSEHDRLRGIVGQYIEIKKQFSECT